MKELIRFQNVCCDCGSGHKLMDYHLTIFAGEIVYVQGISGSGKSVIEYILTGQAQLQSGNLYVHENLWQGKLTELPVCAGIYTIGIKNPMAGKLSIVDNLVAIRRIPRVFSIYSKRKARALTQKYLDAFSIHRSPDTRVYHLTFLEEQLLCLVKAVMDGAQLIILNCVSNIYSHQDALEICRHMKRLSKEGIAFLIISEQPTPFQDIADKIQIIHHGIDLKEWEGTLCNRARLYEYAARVEQAGTGLRGKGRLLYILDYGWDSKYSVFSFLKMFRENYPKIWTDYMGDWHPQEELYYDGSHVIIPQDSGERLLETLTIEDNLAICIPKRAGRLGGSVIHGRMFRVLVNDFFKLLGRDRPVRYMAQLDHVERKILSIYRWELAHPSCIFLENPFWGLDINESMILRRYLLRLKNKGLCLIIFSKNKEEITGNEDLIVTTSKKDTK